MASERRPTRSEGFLEAVLGVAADAPVYVYDRDLRAVDFFWGGDALRWGIDPTLPLGRRLSEVVTPAEAEPFDRVVREVFDTGEPRRFEGAFDLPAGRVWFEVRLAPLRGPDGEVRYVVSVSREVSERRRAEEALRESWQRFETLAESVPVGILRTDAEGRILYRNRLAERLSGVSAGDLAVGGWRQNVHPDDVSRLSGIRNEIFQDPRLLDQELRLVRADGTSTWIFSRSAPTWGEDGRFTGFITSFLDISERKAIDLALRESEHRFRSLAEAMPIGVWRTNREPRLVYANRRAWEILDLEADYPDKADLEGMLARLLATRRIDASVSERLWEEAGRAVEERGLNESQFRLRLADGGERYVQTLAVPEFDSAGSFVGHVGVTIDVTDLERASQELARHRDHLGELVAERTVELERTHEALRRSERLAAVGTFAAGIAHQINNPAGAILLAAQYALEEPGDRARVEAALRDIESEARHCGRIVRGILEFARGPTGEPRPCDLNRIARDCVRRLEAEASERGAALRLALDPGVQEAIGSEASLEQVLVNLVQNSIEAGATEIVVETRQGGDAVEMVVRDDGIGIPDADIDRVFDPLFTTHLARGGTGLGLALARGIVEAGGGSIALRPRGSQGTEVTVRLRPTGQQAALSQRSPA